MIFYKPISQANTYHKSNQYSQILLSPQNTINKHHKQKSKKIFWIYILFFVVLQRKRGIRNVEERHQHIKS